MQRKHALLRAGGDRDLREPFDRTRRARQGALGLIELLHRVLEVAPELIVQADEVLELAADLRDPLLQLARALLHGEPADAERDDLKVREQRVRRCGYDVP